MLPIPAYAQLKSGYRSGEKGKFPVEFGIPLLVAALAQTAGRSLVDWCGLRVG
jgi:hypothetical protein